MSDQDFDHDDFRKARPSDPQSRLEHCEELPPVERRARKIAASKMGLVRDPLGLKLPDDLWLQGVPAARIELATQAIADEHDCGRKDSECPAWKIGEPCLCARFAKVAIDAIISSL